MDTMQQTRINIEALISFVIAQGEDISRQDIATMLLLIRDSIPKPD